MPNEVFLCIQRKKAFHMVTGGGHKRSCHARCLAIGSLPFSASLRLQTTSCKEDWSIFLNGQIWHCPIRPIHTETNQNAVSTSTRYCRPQGNYGMVVMCKLVAHKSKSKEGVTFHMKTNTRVITWIHVNCCYKQLEINESTTEHNVRYERADINSTHHIAPCAVRTSFSHEYIQCKNVTVSPRSG